MTNGGDGIEGFNHSEETKSKMSKSAKKRPKRSDDYFDYCSNKIIDIETKKVYKTIGEAARLNGIKRTTLNAYLSGQLKNKTNLRYLK